MLIEWANGIEKILIVLFHIKIQYYWFKKVILLKKCKIFFYKFYKITSLSNVPNSLLTSSAKSYIRWFSIF